MKRVAIIGHTGAGDYGHYLDQAFTGVEGAEVVAVADPDEEGRRVAMERSGARKGYASYLEMLETEAADIAVVAPHEMTGHVEYVDAAAKHRCHVYVEKPLAATHAAADEMVSVCQEAGVMLVVALPWRGRPEIQELVVPMIKSGGIGEPRLARMYGFGDDRAGDEWMIDLYPHLFDLVWQMYGEPLWCQAVLTQDGLPATPNDRRPGSFGMGLTAGNGIWAHYQFRGLNATFESYAGDGRGDAKGPGHPFRIDIHGTKGTLSLPGPFFDGGDIYFHPDTNPPMLGDDRWQMISHNSGSREDMWVEAHHNMARSMINVIDGGAPGFELCDGRTARGEAAMAMAARASHVSASRIAFPFDPDGEMGNVFDSWGFQYRG